MRHSKVCARFDECFSLCNKSQYTLQVIYHIKRNVNKDKVQFSFIVHCLSNIRKNTVYERQSVARAIVTTVFQKVNKERHWLQDTSLCD